VDEQGDDLFHEPAACARTHVETSVAPGAWIMNSPCSGAILTTNSSLFSLEIMFMVLCHEHYRIDPPSVLRCCRSNTFLLFTPILTEPAGGELDADYIISSVTRLPKRISFVQGWVEASDLKRRNATLLAGNKSTIWRAIGYC
jgi:hypothetical protein